MAKRASEILVSWVSLQHKADPLLTVLEPPSELAGRISHIYLCFRDAKDVDATERRALEATAERLERLEPAPTVRRMPWKAGRAQPTDFERIYEFAKGVLAKIRETHPDERINIHLSPGTKAMFGAWLVLGSGGFVGNVRLVQTREAKFRRDDERVFEEVRTRPEMWSRIVQTAPLPAGGELDDRALWDLAQVQSDSARAVLRQIERWAPTSAPLLLLGERGSGKTTLAHVIRGGSSFRKLGGEPWPVVVCGQFRANPELARSELFGHKKGAFTGADSDRAGLLERVHGDTLFLDEVADLDRSTQRLLMAAVEGRGHTRLGDTVTRKSTFRLLAATNREPAELQKGEVLDLDFLDRIATFVLRLPALRERREDLPMLWRAALRRVGSVNDVALTDADGAPTELGQLAADGTILETLASHALPGNLRDLHRAAWRAFAALSAGRAAAIAEAIAGLGGELSGAEGELPGDVPARLEATERAWLQEALRRAGGNKARAAVLVGMPRKTFAYRWRKLAGGGDSDA